MERHFSTSNLPTRSERSSGRHLQRHATADLSFFTPSSVSFNPRPYFAAMPSLPGQERSISSSSLYRDPSSSALQQKSLDVSYNDPDAVFIRYPFTSFPDAHLYPEGLTYNLMAENPNWFLHPADFRIENDTDPNRVAYPQILEPPRGWCPLKKKEVREKGYDGYNGEDTPKLRCTFCRRVYAGVNAKSMWRRHVLEKHRIPMSNRRDGPSEGNSRGRSLSNKENKRSSSSAPPRKDVFAIQNFFEPKPKEASSTTVLTSKDSSNNRLTQNLDAKLAPAEPATSEEVQEATEKPKDSASGPAEKSKASEPEFVPDDDTKSCSSHRSPKHVVSTLPPSSPLEEGASHLAWLDLSSLPSSPMRTPNYHKKRGPFRMPWKFPSPSHPLYTGPDELCLGVPVGGMTGEGLRSTYVPLQASPFPGSTNNQLQLSSPAAASPLSQKPVTGRVLGWKQSKNRPKSKLPPLIDPSPRRPLYTGPLPVPLDDGLQFAPTPDLSLSADSEADQSFSTLGEPFSTDAFSKWFEMSSPEKGKKSDVLESGLPDTPLRRSSSKSSIDKLQLVSPEKKADKEEESTSSTLLPSGFGLGFNFKINLTTSGSKRARSEEPEDHDFSDDFGELLYPSDDPDDVEQKNDEKKLTHKSANSSISSLSGSSTEREETPRTSTELASEDLDFVFGDSIPMKKRRLFV
ncbi:hypothetical protein ACEPAF_4116 [Sanghuangporus sanghuang]